MDRYHFTGRLPYAYYAEDNSSIERAVQEFMIDLEASSDDDALSQVEAEVADMLRALGHIFDTPFYELGGGNIGPVPEDEMMRRAGQPELFAV